MTSSSAASSRALTAVLEARRYSEAQEKVQDENLSKTSEGLSSPLQPTYAQFEPSMGPPPVIPLASIPDTLTLCRSPFHPFRGPTLWFQPADQPWEGEKSPLALQSPALIRAQMRSREGPMVAVIPHTLDPLPCHSGTHMRISIAGGKNKSYSNMLFNIPDGAVRLTTLMTILKMSGMREMTAEDALQRWLKKDSAGKSKPQRRKSASGAAASPVHAGLAGLAGSQIREEYELIQKIQDEEEKAEELATFARERLAASSLWSLRWCKRIVGEEYRALEPYQRVNHFPGTWGIGRKDRLHKHLEASSRRFGKEHYGFHPEGWLLPEDAEALQKDMRLKAHRPPGQERNVYIVKQVAGARGARMRLLQKATIPKGVWIVQRYIHDPYLIDGYKFDLRIYVVVTSYDPLKIYVYEEGLVRFATSKYPTADAAAEQGADAKKSFKIKDVAAHLTNYSINKNSANFVKPSEGEKATRATKEGSSSSSDDEDDEDGITEANAQQKSKSSKKKRSVKSRAHDEDDDDETDDDDVDVSERGSKWLISTLRRYLETRMNVAWAPLWAKIEDLIIKTLISVEPTVGRVMREIFPVVAGVGSCLGPSPTSIPPPLPFSAYSHPAGSGVHSCFELYGFDVLLKQDLTPILMEVNIMPSLDSLSSLLDQRVKGNMIADLLTLVGAGYSAKKQYKNRIPCTDSPYAAEVLQRLSATAAAVNGVSRRGAKPTGGVNGGKSIPLPPATPINTTPTTRSSLNPTIRTQSANRLKGSTGLPVETIVSERGSGRKPSIPPRSLSSFRARQPVAPQGGVQLPSPPPQQPPSPTIFDAHPYFRTRTPAEIDIICTAEEELCRRRHWKRLFPTSTTYDTYSGFFVEHRPYNVVLSDWEKEKVRNPPAWAAVATVQPQDGSIVDGELKSDKTLDDDSDKDEKEDEE